MRCTLDSFFGLVEVGKKGIGDPDNAPFTSLLSGRQFKNGGLEQ